MSAYEMSIPFQKLPQDEPDPGEGWTPAWKDGPEVVALTRRLVCQPEANAMDCIGAYGGYVRLGLADLISWMDGKEPSDA